MTNTITNAQLQAIMNTVVDGLIIIDDQGSIQSFNPAAENIFGYQATEVINKNLNVLMPEPFHSQHDGYLKNFLKTGQKKVIGIGREVVGRRKDGTTFPMELSVGEAGKKGKHYLFAGIVRDISDRKKVEQQLALRTKHLEIKKDQAEEIANQLEEVAAQMLSVMNTVVDGLITIDAQGYIHSFNSAAEKMFGYEIEEVIDRNINMLMPEPFHSEQDGYLENYLKTGERKVIGVGRQVVGRRKGGATFPMDLSVSESGIKGKRILFTGIVRDISERKKTEKLLDLKTKDLEDKKRQSEEAVEQLQSVMNTAVDGLITIDEQGSIQSFNPAAENIFGYLAEEVMNKNVNTLMPDPFHSAHDGYLKNYLSTGERKIIGIGREVVGRRKDGTTFPMDLSVGDAGHKGKKNLFTGIVRDITDRKKIEQQLVLRTKDLEKRKQQSEEIAEQLQSVMNTVVDGLITINDQCLIQSFNPAAENIFGYKAKEVIGKKISVLMPEPIECDPEVGLENYLKLDHKKMKGTSREEVGKRKDGSTFPMDLSVGKTGHTGSHRLYTGIVRDISERKRLEIIQNEFISTVNHELRTPLTSIQGSLGLLKVKTNELLDDKSKRLLDLSYNNCLRLSNLVDDILDLEKIAAGKMLYKIERTEMCALAKDIVERHLHYGDIYKVSFKVVIHPKALYCMVDPSRFNQALVNLISNATKFSAAGGVVTITVAKQGKKKVCVSVADSGIGIAENFRSKIFGKFEQADSSSTRNKGGSGLGLNITKSIIEAFSGTVSFESEEGVGSTFNFILPLAE